MLNESLVFATVVVMEFESFDCCDVLGGSENRLNKSFVLLKPELLNDEDGVERS